MNAELTAENRSAYVPPDSVTSTEDENETTHEDKERVQILVVLIRIVLVKFSGFPAVYGKEARPGIIGPRWIEEFFEGGMKAESMSTMVWL